MHFPFNEIAQLQSAAYSWTKTPITDFSGSAQKRKNVLKF